MDRRERLREAITLIEDVLGDLDLRQEHCRCCGMKKMTNWDEAQAADRLNGALNRLNKLAGSNIMDPDPTKRRGDPGYGRND